VTHSGTGWIFIRHGESTANAAGVLSGWEDVALTSEGERQARLAGAALMGAPIHRVLSSDLQRARRTAELLLEAARSPTLEPERDPPVLILSALRERRMGEYQGQPIAVLRGDGRLDAMLSWDGRPPGGESHADLARRALPLLAALPEVPLTLLVAHGGMNRVLLGLLDGVEPDELGKHRLANALAIRREVPRGEWARLAERWAQPGQAE
jgi:broad specificity phosphatase PhoE